MSACDKTQHPAWAVGDRSRRQVLFVLWGGMRLRRALNVIYASLGLPGHPCGPTIDGTVNARYRQQWWCMSHDTKHRSAIERATEFGDRTSSLGYSLKEWTEVEPPSLAAPLPVLETDRLSRNKSRDGQRHAD